MLDVWHARDDCSLHRGVPRMTQQEGEEKEDLLGMSCDLCGMGHRGPMSAERVTHREPHV
jgi:hypothetical protein